MVIDLPITNAIERGIRWVQSWTGCSIATINRVSYSLYAVLWIINQANISIRYWWQWFMFAFATLSAVSVALMAFLFHSLDEKQDLADRFKMVVPSFVKHDAFQGLLRLLLVLMVPFTGLAIGRLHRTEWIGAVGGFWFLLGMYCFNVDVYPRTGSKLKNLFKALRNALQPSKLIALPASS